MRVKKREIFNGQNFIRLDKKRLREAPNLFVISDKFNT